MIFQDDSRVQSINDRLINRNLPDITLQNSFDPRPQNTKYHRFPLINRKVKNAYPIQKEPDYQPRLHFNPGSYAPYSGYATNIDSESRMKNIFQPLQKYGNQNYYIPSSNSSLYNTDYIRPNVNQELINKHVLLQHTTTFAQHNPDIYRLNIDRFNGHTRQHVKNIGNKVLR